ncbi:hypothetical protein I3760_01G121800 [Carya illinoinensis]|nr:hypothetical protein I3760_01G121800 [Carya illinoinensis]
MDGDALSTYIKAFDEKLDGLTPINAEDHCIFKVHEQLLKVNEKAYKPMMLAIGPYNDHSKVGQGLMEEHKLQYLKQMSETRNDRSVKEHIKVLKELEGKARKCYVECITQAEDEFVEMMLLDGCFIIELFHKCAGSSPRDEHDPIFELDWMLPKIARDLLLFENQLPFFVLTKLFLMIESKAEIEMEKAKEFFGPVPQNRNEDDKKELCTTTFKMVEKFMRLPFLNKIEDWNSIPNGRELKEAGVEFKKANKFRDTKNMIKQIPNAIELKEGGVKFKKAKQRATFAIQFSNGTFLRNLIAYEQNDAYKVSNYITDYMCFMDDLIDSPKDVELLRRKGIIENWLGEDEVVSTMVNKLGHHVFFSPNNSIYAKTSIDMNKHCAKRWNVWMAKLRHKYFNSPWALLSVLADIILLGLAITQTVFSIIH